MMRILLGDRHCAARNPDDVVVDPVERVVRGIEFRCQLYQQERHLLSILMLRFGRVVSYEEIFDQFWGGPDGGPLSARNVIGVRVVRLRQALAGSAFSVTTRWGLGLLAEPAALAAPRRSYYPPRHQPIDPIITASLEN